MKNRFSAATEEQAGFIPRSFLFLIPVALLFTAFSGCGGPELGGGSRSSSFDSGLSGNYSGFGPGAGSGGGRTPSTTGIRGTYSKVEARFELPDVKGNPFDFTENDVQVTITAPDGSTMRLPAFYDGEKTWVVRFTPTMTGRHLLTSVTLNGQPVQPEKLEKREFDVSGPAKPGFVRRDTRDKTRFVFDSGSTYYPIGHNVGWSNKQPDEIPALFEKMGKAGENWSRVWMCHWDGKNLDWAQEKRLDPGALSLDVAKRWDQIVEAAEKNDIYFQMVLQHHGQYSTRVNPNWDSHPWNKKNGGWLASPSDFFTDPRAIALTRAKYRYIIARWGYSPNILAWELFNEIEGTDAVYYKHADEVVAWHNEMAAFIRKQDPYRHLITTSSTLDIPALWQNMDYIQPHAYPSDVLAALARVEVRNLDKPIFFGEIGPSDGLDRDDGRFLRQALWGSLMSEMGGAAQYWAWDTVDNKNLYTLLRAATDFVRQSGMLSRRGMTSTHLTVETGERAPLIFGPGAGWETAKQTEFLVSPSGKVEGIAAMPAYLHGSAHRDMFPAATFRVTYPAPGTFSVTVNRVARAGAHLVVSVDGTRASEKEFPAGEKDTVTSATLEAQVPAGDHTIRVENTGADWVQIQRFTLSSYTSALAALGKVGKDFAVIWVYNRLGFSPSSDASKPIRGKITLAGLQPGNYKVTWWDTRDGKPVSEEEVSRTASAPLVLQPPAVALDMAAFVVKSAQKTVKKTASAKAASKPGRSP